MRAARDERDVLPRPGEFRAEITARPLPTPESRIASANADTEAPETPKHARIWSMAARLTAYLVAFIVGVTLIAGLIVGAQREDDGPVDLIVDQRQGLRGRRRGELAEAVAVRGNKVIRVGIEPRDSAAAPRADDRHRCQGRRGAAGLQRRARAFHQRRPVARSGQPASTRRRSTRSRTPFASGQRRIPSASGSSAAAGTTSRSPAACRRGRCSTRWCPIVRRTSTAYDGHTGWANTKALKLAGITRRTRNPANGIDRQGSAHGRADRRAEGSGDGADERRRAAADARRRLAAIRAAIGEAHRFGVTSVQNAGGTAGRSRAYDELRKRRRADAARLPGAARRCHRSPRPSLDRLERCARASPTIRCSRPARSS